MNRELLAKYDRPVPRYTSYPTAPHFHAGIGPDDYRGWLGALLPDLRLSLYLHIPFCQSLCWYCGCHTTVARCYAPISDYLDLLLREIALPAAFFLGVFPTFRRLGRDRELDAMMACGHGPHQLLRPVSALALDRLDPDPAAPGDVPGVRPTAAEAAARPHRGHRGPGDLP